MLLIASAYTQVGRLEDNLTKPLLVKADTEHRLSMPPVKSGDAPIAYRSELYELKNPGPGTLRNIVIVAIIEAEYDQEHLSFADGGMAIEDEGDIAFSFKHESKTRTIATGKPVIGDAACDLTSGHSIWFKIVGPDKQWKLSEVSVRAADNSKYAVNDPESKSGPLIANSCPLVSSGRVDCCRCGALDFVHLFGSTLAKGTAAGNQLCKGSRVCQRCRGYGRY